MQNKSKYPELIFDSNNKKKSVVSILIPTFRRIEKLEKAILSVIKQKTEIDYEIIIVDNDQSKDSLNLIKKLSSEFPSSKLMLYQHLENTGLYGNWNSCLYLGSAPWISILSDDDFIKNNWLSEMWKAKESLKDPIVLSCNLDFNKQKYYKYNLLRNAISFYKKNILSKLKFTKLSILDYFIEMPHGGALGILFNRKVAVACGGFNKNYHPCADYKLFSDISFLNNSYLINKKLAVYNIGSNNISLNPETVFQTLLMNRKIQNNLLANLPLGSNFIYRWYIKLFMARSVSGYRKQYRSYFKIKNYVERINLNFKLNSILYLIVKTILLIIASITKAKN